MHDIAVIETAIECESLFAVYENAHVWSQPVLSRVYATMKSAAWDRPGSLP